MKVRVQITKSDIKKGFTIDCECCPNELAVNRLLRGQLYSFTGTIEQSIDKPDGFGVASTRVFSIQNPKKLMAWIRAFDKVSCGDRSGIKPFRYTLDIPQQFLKPSVVKANQPT